MREGVKKIQMAMRAEIQTILESRFETLKVFG